MTKPQFLGFTILMGTKTQIGEQPILLNRFKSWQRQQQQEMRGILQVLEGAIYPDSLISMVGSGDFVQELFSSSMEKHDRGTKETSLEGHRWDGAREGRVWGIKRKARWGGGAGFTLGRVWATRMKTVYLIEQWLPFHLCRNFTWKKFIRKIDEEPEVGWDLSSSVSLSTNRQLLAMGPILSTSHVLAHLILITL